MEKLFRYGVKETMKVVKERLDAIVIDCGAVVTAGTLAAINDLKHIDVLVTLRRYNQTPEVIFDGHLDEILTGLYAQEVEYLLAKKAFGLTYKFTLDLDGVLVLRDGDELDITIDAGSAAFTNLDTAQANSFVKAYTLATNGVESPISCVESYALNTGQNSIDMSCGDNVERIVCAFDFTSPYATSTKAKFASNITVLGRGYELSVPREAVEARNIMMFDDNPESDVNQLVVFKAKDQVMHDVSLKGRLDKAVDADARVIVKRYKLFS